MINFLQVFNMKTVQEILFRKEYIRFENEEKGGEAQRKGSENNFAEEGKKILIMLDLILFQLKLPATQIG